MRHLPGTLVALSVIAFALIAPSSAQAATTAANLVDGTVVTGSTSCGWTDAGTSDNPPNTLTVDRTTVSLSCNDGTPLTLNNDPQVTFDDTAGTATIGVIDISGTKLGMTCRYEATGVALTRSGDTRDYAGGPYTGNLTDGGFFCPGTLTLDQASVSFH